MGVIGQVTDMADRNDVIRRSLRNRRERLGEIRRMYSLAIAYRQELHPEGELPPEELARIKSEIRERLTKERRRQIAISWLIAVLIAVVVAGLLFWIF